LANKYTLTHGSHTITIISNAEGDQHGDHHLTIKYLTIEFLGAKLRYWIGNIRKLGLTEITLEHGKLYQHIFEGIKILSKDQKTFYIEF
jgi:hypothetical protein